MQRHLIPRSLDNTASYAKLKYVRGSSTPPTALCQKGGSSLQVSAIAATAKWHKWISNAGDETAMFRCAARAFHVCFFFRIPFEAKS
jgi:hypothetical protein